MKRTAITSFALIIATSLLPCTSSYAETTDWMSDFHIHGDGTVDGTLKAGDAEISGTLNAGQIKAGGIEIEGTLSSGSGEVAELSSIGSLAAVAGGNDLFVYNGYVYVAGSAGMSIVNVEDPQNPVLESQTDLGGEATQITVSGNYAYIHVWYKGLRIYNVSDPSAPVYVGGTADEYECYGMALEGSYLYMINDEDGLHVYDVSDPASPAVVTDVVVSGMVWGLSKSGDRVYLTSYYSGLWIYDITDPNAPVLIGSIDDDAAMQDVDIEGDYAYVADNTEELRIYDISGDGDPVFVGKVSDPADLCWRVKAEGNHAFTIVWTEGVRVYDVAEPGEPVLVGISIDSAAAIDAEVDGNYLYVEDYNTGLKIYDISTSASVTGVDVSRWNDPVSALEGKSLSLVDLILTGSVDLSGSLTVQGTDILESLNAINAPLDERPAAGDVDMAGNKITNLAEPTDSADAATKQYVDAIVENANFENGVTAGGSEDGGTVVSEEGLVLYMSFDEDEGGTVSDHSAEGNNGTVSGATWTSDGVSGGAYSFDGINDLISIPDSSSLDISGSELTVIAWVKPNVIAGSAYRPIISKWADNGMGNKRSWDASLGGNRSNIAAAWSGDGSSVRSLGGNAALSLNTWQHVAIIIKNGSALVYLNGTLDASTTTGSFGSFYNNDRPTYIGSGTINMNAGQKYFNGLIDEVRVYNRSLSSDEIAGLYEGQGSMSPQVELGKDGYAVKATGDSKFDGDVEVTGTISGDGSGLTIQPQGNLNMGDFTSTGQ